MRLYAKRIVKCIPIHEDWKMCRCEDVYALKMYFKTSDFFLYV